MIQKTAATTDLLCDTGRGLVEIVTRYTQTFLWLQRYDEGLLDEPGCGIPTSSEVSIYLKMML